MNKTNTKLNKELYRKVYLIRTVEEKIREIYPTDVIKTPVHLSLGEEAIAAGVCQAMKPKDQIYGTYRNHGLYLAKGGDLEPFFAELYGKKTGIAKGKAGSMHISFPDTGFMLSSAVVATIIPVALGAAFAAKFQKEDRLVAVFFGDGATEEGVFWETLNFACLKKLPILFVCEDNGLAIHTHITDRQCYKIHEAVKPFGIVIHSSASTDPYEIYNITKTSIREIKKTNAPCFLHLKYHRYLEHVGINEDFCYGYRCKEDYLNWYAADPVKIQRERLLRIGVTSGEIRSLETTVDNTIEENVRKAAEAEFPDSKELYPDVYA